MEKKNTAFEEAIKTISSDEIELFPDNVNVDDIIGVPNTRKFGGETELADMIQIFKINEELESNLIIGTAKYIAVWDGRYYTPIKIRKGGKRICPVHDEWGYISWKRLPSRMVDELCGKYNIKRY